MEAKKNYKPLFITLIIVLSVLEIIACSFITLCIYAVTRAVFDEDTPDAPQMSEYEEYCENLRVTVEKDYDGVKIIEAFNVKQGEEIVDTLFVFTAEEKVFVATTFLYEGSDETQYSVKISSPLTDAKTVRTVFDCDTSFYSIRLMITPVAEEIPNECEYIVFVNEGGTPLFIAVTEVCDYQ